MSEADGVIFRPNQVVNERYIRPDEILVYSVHFENIGEIEAKDVFITDVLDDDLDISTLNIISPEGATFDPQTRTLRWELLDINLLPGATDHVEFSIRPLPGVPSGTEIANRGEIQFEVFDIFPTNEVSNVIDTTIPTGVMTALSAETSTAEFEIAWTGRDEIGEIATFSIFVSVDGEGFVPFLEKTTETRALFSGAEDHTYEFICIATDTAENTELQDASAETSTIVRSPEFIRADANNDGVVNVADGIWTLSYLFHRGPQADCLEAGDANGDKALTLADSLFTFTFRFLGGAPPPPPFPACGSMPGSDCVSYTCP